MDVRIGRAVMIGVLVTVLGSVGFGATYHVATNGTDAAAGTLAAPWRTLRKANQTLQAGDTVLVHGGTYNETIVPARSGAAGRPIVYMRYNADPVEVTGESATLKGIVALGWDLASGSVGAARSYIIIDGFILRYRFASQLPDVPVFSNRFGHVVVDNSQSVHNEIRNCVIEQPGGGLANFEKDFRQAGILVGFAQHTVIEGNDISGMWIGVWLCGEAPRYNIVRGNYIHDVGSSGIDIADPETGETGLQGNLIEWNMIDGSANEDGIQFEPNYQSDFSVASNRGTIIRGNIIRGCAENAFDLKGASRIVIEGNVVCANTGDDDGPVGGNDRFGGMGGVIHGGTGTEGVPSATGDVVIRNNVFFDNFGAILVESGYKVYNNTIVANNRDYTGSNSSWRATPGPGFTALLAYDNTDCAILNNIIMEHAQCEASLNTSGLVNADINHNIYAHAGGAQFAEAGGAAFTKLTFTQWQQRLASRGIRGAEANSLEANPQFRSVTALPTGYETTLDFNLANGSPAIDKGGALTRVRTTGSGTSLPVDDSRFFHDGFGVTTGDSIVIGTRGTAVITAINPSTHVLTLNRSMSWSAGDPVYRPFHGSAPDMGALEYTDAVPGLVGAATLLTPASGSSGVAATPVLAWTPAEGASSYWLQVAVDPGFSNKTVERLNIRDTTAWATGLEQGTIYYWRVRAIGTGSVGAWSEVSTFALSGSVEPPQKTETNLLQNGDFEAGNANWAFYAGSAASWSVDPNGQESSNGVSVAVSSAGSSIQLYQSGIALDQNTMYAIRFAAYSTSGRPLKVSLFQHGAPYYCYGIYRHEVALTTGWNSYLLYVSSTLPSASVTDARLQFWFADNAQAGDVYRIDDVSLAAVGAVAGLSSPRVSYPTNGAEYVPDHPTLRWAAVTGADMYQVQVSSNAAFTEVVFDTLVADLSVPAYGLLPASVHYMRVRSLQVNGYGAYGTTIAFSTGAYKTAVDDEAGIPARLALHQNYPNPFNPTTQIRYELPAAGDVRLAVYSSLGEEVARLVDGRQHAGVHEVSMDATALASGVYFYQLRTAGAVETRRMVLVR